MGWGARLVGKPFKLCGGPGGGARGRADCLFAFSRTSPRGRHRHIFVPPSHCLGCLFSFGDFCP